MNDQKKVKSDEFFGVSYFDAIEVGRSLKEVAVDTIKTESQEILSRWYHSDREVDIYVWMDSRRNIIKQQVHLFGQLVEWNILDGVRTGVLVEIEDKIETKASEVVHFDSSPVGRAVRQAMDVIENAGHLSSIDRQLILANFQEGKTINDIETDEFLRRFGSCKEQVSHGFWDKVRQWIKF